MGGLAGVSALQTIRKFAPEPPAVSVRGTKISWVPSGGIVTGALT